MMNKCTSIAGNLDNHVDTWVQCGVHCLMQHVKGCTRCRCTLLLDKYVLPIAPAATSTTGSKTTMKTTPHLLAILMVVLMLWYNTTDIAQLRRFRAY
jgi:hypothetical protein